MNNQQPRRQQRQEREKLLHQYMDALQVGDFEQVMQILRIAEQNPELENLIWDVHTAYVVEVEREQRERRGEGVQQLLPTPAPSAWGASAREEIPSLTVGDVIARMQADKATEALFKGEFMQIAQQLRRSSQPLPVGLGLHGVRKLLLQLGVPTNKQFEKHFSQTALFLLDGRQQERDQLAAARKQAEHKRFPGKHQTDETREQE
jgi:hypothetical protein